uniref:Uncharacterized protein n=1 Tax=Rhizophora mucronata TaxID=61149 RepID=A0A2P2JJZ4_RHIMU
MMSLMEQVMIDFTYFVPNWYGHFYKIVWSDNLDRVGATLLMLPEPLNCMASVCMLFDLVLKVFSSELLGNIGQFS